MNLLHVIPNLGPGGPTRCLVTFVKLSRISHPDIRHVVVTLQSADHYMPLVLELKRQGVEILRGSGRETTIARIDNADVVLLHFWSTPRFWRLLAGDLPAARYLLWVKVLGAHAPQLFNRRLLADMAQLVFTAKPPPEVATEFETARVVPGLVDNQRVGAITPRPHAGFNADYIGTTNRGKMHPRFIDMMARLDIADLKVRICGGVLDPGIAAAIGGAPMPERFECLGFVEDIASVLQTSDVFAYPLAERTYATSDKSLQEAMLAGVPPVILPHGGPVRFVIDGRNGIVARSEDEFVEAIQHLHRHPDKRRALGREARQSALAMFSAERHVATLMRTIEATMPRPKRRLLDRGDPTMPARSPSLLFLLSQDWNEAAAQDAIIDWHAGRTAALEAYAQGLDDDAFQVEGGILHWRNECPEDPLLRFWTALWLKRHDRHDEADREMAEAMRLGAPEAAAQL
ncbi:glycosyltransferase family 4 protein [Mesorhizobium sp. ES1-4]|uniref:glycosyltransferase family 4 protein n=1 Tax=Mesorhizobium sp. ES1-4 TaxID=2876627 RepID=UPI001CC9807C|nr:glycosyltransferase family 4 protein [Mesorhizobium sp. ES1-4]MBZ9796271.1 glycosyltransferase family 4 protein [Mesorhizobium sp. ES1-4]